AYMAHNPRFGLEFAAALVRENLDRLARTSQLFVENRTLVQALAAKNDEVAEMARLASESPDAIVRLSEDGTLLYANAPASPLVGAWRTGVGEAMPIEWQHRVRTAMSSNEPMQIEMQASASTFELVLMPVPERSYANLYGRNVTEERH